MANRIRRPAAARCVVPLEEPADRPVALWLDAMKNRYRVKNCRQFVVDMAAPGAKARNEHYVVYEFVPRNQTMDRADLPR